VDFTVHVSGDAPGEARATPAEASSDDDVAASGRRARLNPDNASESDGSDADSIGIGGAPMTTGSDADLSDTDDGTTVRRGAGTPRGARCCPGAEPTGARTRTAARTAARTGGRRSTRGGTRGGARASIRVGRGWR
jgi:hypothetical protein